MPLHERQPTLAAWQWNLYPHNHGTRANLVVHVLTVPLFWAGTVALFTAPFIGWLGVLGGPLAMVVAIAAQGRGHRGELVAPVPFAGPADAVARIVVEQWFTFPRYVLRGGLARAWRAAAHAGLATD